MFGMITFSVGLGLVLLLGNMNGRPRKVQAKEGNSLRARH